MKKPLIAIDCDEVLMPLHEPLMLHHNDTYGTDYAIPDPAGRYYLDQYTDEPHDVVMDKVRRFVGSPEFGGLEPIKDSVETINHLTNRYTLAVVTARQDFMQEITKETLRRYFGKSFESIHFTPYAGNGKHASKLEVCQELGANFIIDDTLLTVTSCAKAGLEAILFGEYHWNKSVHLPPGVSRCKDWAAVKEYFDAR